MTNIKRLIPIVLTAFVTVKVVNKVRQAQQKVVLNSFLDLVTQGVDEDGFTVGYVGEDGWPESASAPDSFWAALDPIDPIDVEGFNWLNWLQKCPDIEGFTILSDGLVGDDIPPFVHSRVTVTENLGSRG